MATQASAMFPQASDAAIIYRSRSPRFYGVCVRSRYSTFGCLGGERQQPSDGTVDWRVCRVPRKRGCSKGVAVGGR
eukprot:501304-Lingulodinium_polyedra.AAC.1